MPEHPHATLTSSHRSAPSQPRYQRATCSPPSTDPVQAPPVQEESKRRPESPCHCRLCNAGVRDKFTSDPVDSVFASTSAPVHSSAMISGPPQTPRRGLPCTTAAAHRGVHRQQYCRSSTTPREREPHSLNQQARDERRDALHRPTPSPMLLGLCSNVPDETRSCCAAASDEPISRGLLLELEPHPSPPIIPSIAPE